MRQNVDSVYSPTTKMMLASLILSEKKHLTKTLSPNMQAGNLSHNAKLNSQENLFCNKPFWWQHFESAEDLFPIV